MASPVSVSAKFLVDASGPRGFLHRILGLSELDLPGLPPTQALYSHFEGVRRMENLYPMLDGESPPYPVDDAAVHHVFDGGWIWVLQFNNGVTSAGVAATDAFAENYGFTSGAEAWQRILDRIPALESQFASAQPIRPFTCIPRLAFRSGQIAGRRWALLPSAAGFVDPLLSTGFPLTLLGVGRLAEILANDWDSPRLASSLAEYAAQTDADLLATARLIGALYANMSNFPVFVVAVAALLRRRQLLRSRAPPRQAAPRPVISPARPPRVRAGLSSSSRTGSTAAHWRRIPCPLGRDHPAIEPFNVAGLAILPGRNWYPVDLDDLLKTAAKLEASQDEVMELFERCGFQLR